MHELRDALRANCGRTRRYDAVAGEAVPSEGRAYCGAISLAALAEPGEGSDSPPRLATTGRRGARAPPPRFPIPSQTPLAAQIAPPLAIPPPPLAAQIAPRLPLAPSPRLAAQIQLSKPWRGAPGRKSRHTARDQPVGCGRAPKRPRGRYAAATTRAREKRGRDCARGGNASGGRV